MANIITSSFFIADLEIGQSDTSAVSNSLNQFIAIREKKYLDLILGEQLSKLFRDNITSEEDKWKNLKAKFVIDVTDTIKQSPIANYIYYWYMRKTETAQTGSGEVNLKKQNSNSTSARIKAARAWNEMVRWNKAVRKFVKDSSDYPEYNEPKRSSETYGEWKDLYSIMNPYL